MKRYKRALAYLVLSTAAMPFPVSSQPANWTSRGPGGGGALYQPAISPNSASTMFISCDMSEVFRTTDGAQTWRIVDYRSLQGNSNAGRVAFTSNPLILYALDGSNDQYRPTKSTNGGLTWSLLPADPTSGGAFSLYADPASTSYILMSDYTKIYYSADSGKSFSQKFTANVNGGGCHVAGAFFDGPFIYVGTNAGLLVSTDAGATFSVAPVGGIAPGEVMVSFAGGKQGSMVRLFCVTMNSADVYAGITGADFSGYKNIYSLDVGQANWIPRGSGVPSGTFPFFVSMARNSIDIAYVAGGSNASVPTVLKTTNGGQTWQNVFLTANNQNILTGWSGSGGDRGWSYGEYALGFTVAPLNPNVALITDLGFAHLTANGGATWRQAYLSVQDQNPANAPTPTGKAYHGIGLENTSCWDICWDDSSQVFVGQTDIRGMRTTDAGATWSFAYTGHTLNTMYRIAWKYRMMDVEMYAATSSVHDLYQSTYLTDARINPSSAVGRVLRSTNAGETWTLIHEFPSPVVWVETDPYYPNRLYASVVHPTQGGVYVTNNLLNGPSSTWTKLANPPRTEGHPYNIRVLGSDMLVCSYSGRRAGSPQAFTASSGVFLSTDAGTTWLDRSIPAMHYWTKDVVIDPFNRATWYCGVFSGWGGAPNGLGGLYRTTNFGVSWTRILQLDRVESCEIRPDSPEEMYVTTETDGLWYTSNRTAANPTFTNVASFTFRHPMRVFFNPHNFDEVWVTTFGGGLFSGTALKVPVEIESFTGEVADGNVHLVWVTSREVNSKGFFIDRGCDRTPDGYAGPAASWLTVGYCEGAGSSNLRTRYTFIDGKVERGGQYRYRLRQVDLDGSVQYSTILHLAIPDQGAPRQWTIFPNPISRGEHAELHAPADAPVDIIDVFGREVMKIPNVSAMMSGSAARGIDTDMLQPGYYWCRIHGRAGFRVLRLVVFR